MFYECLKLGIKDQTSVLNRVGKSAIFVLIRVRVWGAEPHLPTQGYIEYQPPPPLGHKPADKDMKVNMILAMKRAAL